MTTFLRVDLDWGSTGLWVLKKPFQETAGGNASYAAFRLPQWLIDRFDVWAQWHDAWEPWNDNKNEPDHELFEAYGLSLAIDLKRFLGPGYHVEYRGKEIVYETRPTVRANARNRSMKTTE